VLAHRIRRRPFEETTFDLSRLDSLCGGAADGGDSGDGGAHGAGAGSGEDERTAVVALAEAVEEAAGSVSDVAASLTAEMDRLRRAGAGRRQATRSADARGRYVKAEEPRAGAQPDLALDATIRAAAPFQKDRDGGMAINVERGDIRNKVRKRKVSASIVFCVDASGSMAASTRMQATKTAVLELLVGAYQHRDRVGLVSFRGDGAEVLLAPTASVELAQLRLKDLATGGATPLAHGIVRSLELLAAERRRNDGVVPWLVLVTDGRANVGIGAGLGSEDARAAAAKVRESRVRALVIDTSTSVASGAARELARLTGGEYVRLASFEGKALAGAVRDRLDTA
jgi:magnesium chelatase subunit D